MGDKDFIKPLLERRGTVFFGKVGGLVVQLSASTLFIVMPCRAVRCCAVP